MELPTHERLLAALDYDQSTGVFRWRLRTSTCVQIGDIAGTTAGNSYGYRRLRLDGYLGAAHQWAWYYVTGFWPSEIDHLNGNRKDNRFANLREVGRTINAQNLRGAHKDSASGLLGVEKHRHAFHARIMVRGRRHYLGTFGTAQEAHAAYLVAKRELHQGCTI